MSWIAYTYIHVSVHAGHILDMEDMCVICNWNYQKKCWIEGSFNKKGHKMNFFNDF